MMTFAISQMMTRMAVVGCLGGGALAAGACADGGLTGPSGTANVSGLTATAPQNDGTGRVAASGSPSSPRDGALHVTKECSQYTGLAGSFCTITSSNLAAIEVGSRIVYAQAAGAASLDSDITLDLPGPGNNTARGHCALDSATGIGRCTFAGGTGKFEHFQADARVSYLGGPNWAWNGTYSFNPHD